MAAATATAALGHRASGRGTRSLLPPAARRRGWQRGPPLRRSPAARRRTRARCASAHTHTDTHRHAHTARPRAPGLPLSMPCGAPVCLDVESRGTSLALAPPPRVCGEVYFPFPYPTLPYLTLPQVPLGDAFQATRPRSGRRTLVFQPQRSRGHFNNSQPHVPAFVARALPAPPPPSTRHEAVFPPLTRVSSHP